MSKILLEAVLIRNYGWKRYDKYSEYEDCAVCWDTLKDTCVLETTCGHFFHPECVIEAIINYDAKECLIPECSQKFVHFNDKAKI